MGPSNTANVYPSQHYSAEDIKLAEWKYNGLDRVDSLLPHNKDNVVPCCARCNRMKSDMSFDDFLKRISDIFVRLPIISKRKKT